MASAMQMLDNILLGIAIRCTDKFMGYWECSDDCLKYMNDNKVWMLFDDNVFLAEIQEHGYRYEEILNSLGEFLTAGDRERLTGRVLKAKLTGSVLCYRKGVDNKSIQVIENTGRFVMCELMDNMCINRGYAMYVWYNSRCKRIDIEESNTYDIPKWLCYERVLSELKAGGIDGVSVV